MLTLLANRLPRHARPWWVARRATALPLALAVLLGCASPPVPAFTPAVAAAARVEERAQEAELERTLARLAERAGGEVGVAAIHIESGRRVSLRGGERFPMASVYKLPIALQLLHRVDRSELRLSDSVRIEPRDFRPGHSPLAEAARGRAVTLTVDELLERMLGGSDNTASDVLLRLAGGPAAVTARLRELGVDGIDVSRSEAELNADIFGVPVPDAGGGAWVARFDSLRAVRSPAELQSTAARFLADPRDTSIPGAMAELLVQVQRREVLQPATVQRLLEIMTATPTGANRLKGLLPPGTPVAHKTGTWPSAIGTTNDAGIITLPGDAGHVAIAVLTLRTTAPFAEQERTIAEIARAVYDFFVSSPDSASHAPGEAVGVPSSLASAAAPAPRPDARRFTATLARRIDAQYLLYLPRTYEDESTRWPLILYLHGGSLRGENIDTVRIWGVPRVAERDPSFPFVVLAPQAPVGTLWTGAELLIALLADVIARYRIDPERVYLTGHSMGGNGAWYLAYLYPEHFAAVAPMSGPANPWWATRLRSLPVWVFHGEDDAIVPLRESQEMVQTLRAGGGEVRFSVLAGRDHGILDVYDDPELYRWFLQHRRR